jgi:predicted ArsR family transcriptional regulator
MIDLFSYPKRPGYKTLGTSKEAADKMTRGDVLRNQIMKVLETTPSTADECAAILGENILTIRPRISELLSFEMIEKSGKTRPNASGRSATVWRVRNDY